MRCIGMIALCACCVCAQEGPRAPGGAACSQLYRAVAPQVGKQEAAEAGATVLAVAAQGPGLSCAGLVLTELASLATVSGRPADAASLAERAVRVLEHEYPQDDPVLLRPLYVLAASQFEQGQTARAREVFQRMQSIRILRPEDGALLHDLGGWLLENQGRYKEAESEYTGALSELERAHLGNAMDTGAIFTALGSLYIKENRLNDARRALDRAVEISTSAADAAAADCINALHLRGVLHARLREWVEAGTDMHEALSIADGEPLGMDPVLLATLLTDYAQVLRKNHHARDARSIEARAAGLHGNAPTLVVDVTELGMKATPLRK